MIESPLQVDIPVTDIPSYVFSTGTASSREAPQYFDAESPSQNFSLSQAEIFVKQFARGLEVLGLQPNDKVLLYSHNRLFFPVLLWGVLAARCVFTAASPAASINGKHRALSRSARAAGTKDNRVGISVTRFRSETHFSRTRPGLGGVEGGFSSWSEPGMYLPVL